MRWKINAERTLYRDQWVHLLSADVELPDGRHLDHRLVRTGPGAGTVVVDQGRVLLMVATPVHYRHLGLGDPDREH